MKKNKLTLIKSESFFKLFIAAILKVNDKVNSLLNITIATNVLKIVDLHILS